ncbi:dihydropteroate synthase [Nonomuraea sp. B12E4]|uniref:dihydropteroate synthase n=1 Tax=Nonomuraea sp. B12E4 TaxID=3153564 RepID=UPI00325EAC27
MEAYYPRLIAPVRRVGKRYFDFSAKIVVMAIVNVTPNSGLDPNRSLDMGRAVATAERAIREGADWIDVGGRAFRADQEPLTAEQEIARVVPAIREIRAATDAVISVDTHLARVAEAACEAGADVVNSTNGLRDPGLAEVIADAGAGVVIAHSLVGPHVHAARPAYRDVVRETKHFLRDQLGHALASKIEPERIFIDPGHDLNKTTDHSNELTRRLPEITELGYPTVVAVSNKHFVRESLGVGRDHPMLTEGTVAANVICAFNGARIVRVHDVGANVTAMRAVEALLRLRDTDGPGGS